MTNSVNNLRRLRFFISRGLWYCRLFLVCSSSASMAAAISEFRMIDKDLDPLNSFRQLEGGERDTQKEGRFPSTSLIGKV